MSVHTARFDRETETALQHIQTISGMSVSECLKMGIKLLQKKLSVTPQKRPYDILKNLNLGAGREDIPPASEAKKNIVTILKRKKHS